MDIELMEQQVLGMEARLKELRATGRLFDKAQGLDQTSEKARVKADEIKDEVKADKEKLKGLKAQKADAVGKTAGQLAEAMGKFLPEGEAVFDVTEDGKVSLVWKRDHRTVPYHGLSGGQKVVFDAALTSALLGGGKGKTLILEAAEVDCAYLSKTLENITLQNPDAQVIVNTWSKPDRLPEGWQVVELGGTA